MALTPNNIGDRSPARCIAAGTTDNLVDLFLAEIRNFDYCLRIKAEIGQRFTRWRSVSGENSPAIVSLQCADALAEAYPGRPDFELIEVVENEVVETDVAYTAQNT